MPKLNRRDLLRSGIMLSTTPFVSRATLGQAGTTTKEESQSPSMKPSPSSVTNSADRPKPVRYLFSMVHHNPGEPLFITKYVNPEYLRKIGYNGDAAKIYIQAAITYQDFDPELISQDSPTYAWIQRHAHNQDHTVNEHKKAAVPLFPFTDVLVVPRELMDKYGSRMRDENGRLSIQETQTQAALRAQIEHIFRRFPDLGGLTTRFGETYLCDIPFHVGGKPVYGPKDHTVLIKVLRNEICVKRNKKLIYRTWDFGRLHTHPDIYLEATNPVEPHPNLIFSIKHSNGDFIRGVPLNRTLGIGRHQQIVEVSMMQAGCYGKGAYPYYIGRGVLHGWPEMSPPQGIDYLVRSGKVVGLWTWPRGDGWGGPYISNEFWVDLNMYVISEFCKRPWLNDQALFEEYSRSRLHLDDASTKKLYEMCLLSTHAVFIGAQSAIFKITPWWQRDDKLTAVDLRDVDQPRVLAEKARAVSEWKQIEALSRQVHLPNPEDQEFLEVSSSYGRIYFSIIEQLWTLQVLEYHRRDDGNKQKMRQSLKQYDLLWSEWQKLEHDHSCCATLYMTLWPQTFPPTWREHPDELINKALFNHGAGHTHDTPLVSRCRATVA